MRLHNGRNAGLCFWCKGLLAALSANAGDATPDSALPSLPSARIVGESPWLELSQLRADATSPAVAADTSAESDAGSREPKIPRTVDVLSRLPLMTSQLGLHRPGYSDG